MRRTAQVAAFLLVVAILLPFLVLPAVADQAVQLGITDTPTPTSTPTVTPSAPPPVVPEGSTLLLLGTSTLGLATYVALQVRARRLRP